MQLSPLDENGSAVDWWFMYKVPKLTASALTDAADGYEYFYYDSQSQANGRPLSLSPYRLDGDDGALHHTLDALFASPGVDTGWILYNDEVPPDGPTSMTLGHTKGVLGFDAKSGTGFWLLHSWPKFPLPDDSANPSPMYGQTFLCLSLDIDSMRKLATQMLHYQQPQVYDPRIPLHLADSDPLRLLTTSVTDQDSAGSNELSLTTRGGMNFDVIAKNRNWNDDFWNNLVVDDLKVNIAVDTWVNGVGAIPDTEDPSHTYSVEDIKYISMEALGKNWAWKETRDHAKWAISVSGGADWICVGDINRKVTQRLRGGCTIAFSNTTLWNALGEVDEFVVPKDSHLTADQVREGVSHVAAENVKKAAEQRRRN